MASGISDYLEIALLNAVFRNTAYTSPTTTYLGLFTATPSDSGGGTEVTGNAYARQAVTFSAPTTGTGTTEQVVNSGAVAFPTATPSGWGTITGVGIFDASTAGNLLYWGDLSASQAVGAGNTFQINASGLVITLD